MWLSIEADEAQGARVVTHPGTATLNQLQAAVGGYIGTAGKAPGDAGNPSARILTVWCDDDGWVKDETPPQFVAIGRTLRTDAPYQIAGGVAITCTDLHTGEFAPMTADEVARVRLEPYRLMQGRVCVGRGAVLNIGASPL